jgi:hypothetical protein
MGKQRCGNAMCASTGSDHRAPWTYLSCILKKEYVLIGGLYKGAGNMKESVCRNRLDYMRGKQ